MSESLWPDTKVPIIPKRWGYEKVIDNNKQYCGKLLHFVAGSSSSTHFHRVKTETFYLHKGAVEVLLYPDGERLHDWYLNHQDHHAAKSEVHDMMERIILRQGQRLKIPVNTAHQINALEDSELFEFSTEDFEDDSYRIIKSDEQ